MRLGLFSFVLLPMVTEVLTDSEVSGIRSVLVISNPADSENSDFSVDASQSYKPSDLNQSNFLF